MDRHRPVAELNGWRFRVPPGKNQRLDSFLADRLELSRRVVRRSLEHARLEINGRPVKKGSTVRPGDLILVDNPGPYRTAALPNPRLPIALLYQDADVVAINKPPGIPSVAVRGLEAKTVASFLVAQYPEMTDLPEGDREAGLVHRLDTGTSGLLVAARTPAAYEQLRRAFSKRQVRKGYVALVKGEVLKPGVVKAPLACCARHQHRMMLWRPGKKARQQRAVTYFRPVRRVNGATLLAVRITTGVRHQIRLHLASTGHPVVGDILYGGTLDELTGQPRLLLHCHRLLIPRPRPARTLSLHALIPPDWHSIIGGLPG